MTLSDFLFCDFAFLDRFHRLCAVGVTHEIVVPGLPIGIPRGTIVARMRPDESDKARKVTLSLQISVDGKSARPDSTEGIQFIQEPGYVFVVFRFFQIDVPGVYEFTLLLDGRPAGSLSVPVLIKSSTSDL